MKVSTKGRYGLRAMIEIASHPGSGHVPLALVAERQGISGNYLEQVVALLRKGGFIRSVKGAHGGYRLTRPAREIRVGDLLRVLEGSLSVMDGDDPAMAREAAGQDDAIRRAIRAQVWERIDRSVADVVDAITLEDLVEEARKKGDPGALHYEI